MIFFFIRISGSEQNLMIITQPYTMIKFRNQNDPSSIARRGAMEHLNVEVFASLNLLIKYFYLAFCEDNGVRRINKDLKVLLK